MVRKLFVVVPLMIEINLRGFFVLLLVQANSDGRSDRRDCLVLQQNAVITLSPTEKSRASYIYMLNQIPMYL